MPRAKSGIHFLASDMALTPNSMIHLRVRTSQQRACIVSPHTCGLPQNGPMFIRNLALLTFLDASSQHSRRCQCPATHDTAQLPQASGLLSIWSSNHRTASVSKLTAAHRQISLPVWNEEVYRISEIQPAIHFYPRSSTYIDTWFPS